jgi:hypothetical protein
MHFVPTWELGIEDVHYFPNAQNIIEVQIWLHGKTNTVRSIGKLYQGPSLEVDYTCRVVSTVMIAWRLDTLHPVPCSLNLLRGHPPTQFISSFLLLGTRGFYAFSFFTSDWRFPLFDRL